MRMEQVEIYSDASNAAVIRHPGRRYPGVLIQGDTLSSFVSWLSQAASEAEDSNLSEEAIEGIAYVFEMLSNLSDHYAAVVTLHGIQPPEKRA